MVAVEVAEQKYDAAVDAWLGACERASDGYSSHSMDSMLAARAALTLSAAELGVRMPTAIELVAVGRMVVAS